jgi:hypothetical protein
VSGDNEKHLTVPMRNTECGLLLVLVAEEEQDCVTEGAGMSLASGGMW